MTTEGSRGRSVGSGGLVMRVYAGPGVRGEVARVQLDTGVCGEFIVPDGMLKRGDRVKIKLAKASGS